MKVVIMGCGRVGAQLAAMLDSEGHQVTVLDVDPYSFKRLPPSFSGSALLGDGTDMESLRKAGTNEADAFIAVTEGDTRNAMAAQIAKHLFGVARVICRIDDPLREELYHILGLEAFSPPLVFAQLLKDDLVKQVGK